MPTNPYGHLSNEAIIAQMKIAQTQLWEASMALEERLGFDIDTNTDLEDMTIDNLVAEFGPIGKNWMSEETTEYNEVLAMSQGWLLADNDVHGLRIEKYDMSGRYRTDEEALRAVKCYAEHGDKHAAYCLNRVDWNL